LRFPYTMFTLQTKFNSLLLNPLVEVTVNTVARRKTLKTFAPVTSKNSASSWINALKKPARNNWNVILHYMLSTAGAACFSILCHASEHVSARVSVRVSAILTGTEIVYLGIQFLHSLM
jgi:hypothetical protein